MYLHIIGAYTHIGNWEHRLCLANARTITLSEFAVLNPVNFNPVDVKRAARRDGKRCRTFLRYDNLVPLVVPFRSFVLVQRAFFRLAAVDRRGGLPRRSLGQHANRHCYQPHQK